MCWVGALVTFVRSVKQVHETDYTYNIKVLSENVPFKSEFGAVWCPIV